MRLRVLGPLQLCDETGRAVALRSPNQAVVLAVLVAHRGSVVSASTLIDALWGADPPASAMATLRTYVSRLRGVVGAAIATAGDGWMFEVDVIPVDADEFEESLHGNPQGAVPPDPITVGRAGARPRTVTGGQVDGLRSALALWRGGAFSGLSELGAVRSEAARLDSRRRSGRRQLIEALLADGDPDDAVTDAEAFVADEPLDEPAWCLLVAALAAAGRKADALRAFQRAARALAEAGLEPSMALRNAERLALEGPPRPAVPRTSPHTPLSSLIGRDDELAAVARLVDEYPLVTLVGPGGVGKTRLARELVDRAATRHEEGSRVIELARLDPADSLVDAVLDSLGVLRGERSALEAVERLGDLDLLVVLDNCEHLLEEVCELVERILRRGGRMRVLATSRQRLGLPGEQVSRLKPLDVAPGGPAQQLFTDRARSGTATTDGLPAAAVQAIVRRLDGLPLAIEMAAARLDAMTCGELAEMLETKLTTLQAARHGGDPRHRTLVSAVEWSEDLLDDDERWTFAAFSVFAGPVESRDIAGVLGNDSVELVRRLAGRSLIVADVSGDRARYHQLETVKAHAAARLALSGHGAEIAERHARYVLAAAQAADGQLETAEEAAGDRRFNALFGELRAAHRWARAHDDGLAAALSSALHWWAYTRARDECFAWAEMALGGSAPHEVPPALRASVATRASYIGRLHEACEMAHDVISAAPGTVHELNALTTLADTLTYLGDLAGALQVARRLLALGQARAAARYEVYGLASVALALSYDGRPEDVADELGQLATVPVAPTDQALAAYAIGEAHLEGDPAAALSWFDRAIRSADAVGSRFISGVARVSSVCVHARHGDLVEALAAFADVITYWQQTGMDVHQLTTLRNLPALLRRADAATECALILGAAEREDVQPTYGEEATRLEGDRAWARGRLGDEAFARHYRAGADLDIGQAARTALTIIDRLQQTHTT